MFYVRPQAAVLVAVLLLGIAGVVLIQPNEGRAVGQDEVIVCVAVPRWEWLEGLLSPVIIEQEACVLKSGSVTVHTRPAPASDGQASDFALTWLSEFSQDLGTWLREHGVDTDLSPQAILLSPGFLSVVGLVSFGLVYFFIRRS